MRVPRFTVKFIPSPNQSTRIHGNDAVRLVVAHTPEGRFTPMVAYMTDPNQSRKVSYHQLISEDGKIVAQLVPFEKKAWHAGPINSLSDGISAAGWAKDFNVASPQAWVFADLIARRLVARGLPCQWTTDPAKGGFCRHADLQSDRRDPMPLEAWSIFCAMISERYEFHSMTPPAKAWPVPIPAWFWPWAIWRFAGRPEGQRPGNAPRFIPLWAWRRLKALEDARRK